jgi:hypothetical protein
MNIIFNEPKIVKVSYEPVCMKAAGISVDENMPGGYLFRFISIERDNDGNIQFVGQTHGLADPAPSMDKAEAAIVAEFFEPNDTPVP